MTGEREQLVSSLLNVYNWLPVINIIMNCVFDMMFVVTVIKVTQTWSLMKETDWNLQKKKETTINRTIVSVYSGVAEDFFIMVINNIIIDGLIVMMLVVTVVTVTQT